MNIVEVKGKIPISFNLAKEFYEKGHTIRRIGRDKFFNKIDSTIIASAFGVMQLSVTLEDIEADDWEVLALINEKMRRTKND